MLVGLLAESLWKSVLQGLRALATVSINCDVLHFAVPALHFHAPPPGRCQILTSFRPLGRWDSRRTALCRPLQRSRRRRGAALGPSLWKTF